ncbi:hypothetical protein CDEST_01142 [Colletotrichum destructivum]|uniref:Uncharacterized protein n=1 Tax=Colletotrichum destructivum TaxID=34406 RepID=A0AAX4HY70_9PEZI|nr:hypothetical protein CDEST_01142 [Colletotrichum destructivum]
MYLSGGEVMEVDMAVDTAEAVDGRQERRARSMARGLRPWLWASDGRPPERWTCP